MIWGRVPEIRFQEFPGMLGIPLGLMFVVGLVHFW